MAFTNVELRTKEINYLMFKAILQLIKNCIYFTFYVIITNRAKLSC